MPYVDSAGLSRFDSRQKDRIKREYALLRDMQWLRTEKAGAVTCWPVGGTPLETAVDFLFTETPPAEGDKGPGNPSTITGVSSIECSYGGKNLLYYPLDTLTKTIEGVTFTYNNDGSFSVSGTSTHNPVMYRIAYSTENRSVYSYLPAGTYTLSGCPANGSWGTTALVLINSNGNALTDNLGNTVIDYGSGRTFTIDEPKRIFCMMRLGYAVGTNISNIVYKPQLEIGSSATALEPADRSKLSFPLGSTYYGGTVDLATGVMTVTHEVRYITPNITFYSNSFREDSNRYGLYLTPTYAMKKTGVASDYVCNYFDVVYNNYQPSKSAIMVASSNYGVYLFLDKQEFGLSDGLTMAEVITAMRPWFEGKDVRFYYPLATPYIVQLDSISILALSQIDKYTPRLNTVYTDAQAVQAGYIKSPIREEYELQQAVAAQGGGV